MAKFTETQTKLLRKRNSCRKYKQSTKFSLKVWQDWNVIIVFVENYRLQELDKLKRFITGAAKRRVMKWRFISESYDFEELCPNHAHCFKTATPYFLTLLMFI